MRTIYKVIFFILALIIVGIIVLAIFGAAQKGAPNEVVQVSQQDSFKTYSGNSLTFRYPNDFTATTTLDGDELLIPLKTYFQTHLINEAYISIDTPSATCRVVGDGAEEHATTTINGLGFNKIFWSGVGAGNLYQGIDYTTMKNDLCYRVALYTHSTNGEGFYTNDQAQIKRVDDQQKVDMDALMKLFTDGIATTLRPL